MPETLTKEDWSKPLENLQHERFAQLVAAGEEQGKAYQRIYPGVSPASVHASASRLLRNVKQRVQWLQGRSASATTLSMRERREFLARVVRSKLHALDLEKDGDLVQEIVYNSGEEGGGVKKLRLPGKRECIMADAELAGELAGTISSVTLIQVHLE